MAKNKKIRKVTPKKNQTAKRIQVMSNTPTANRKVLHIGRISETSKQEVKNTEELKLQKEHVIYWLVLFRFCINKFSREICKWLTKRQLHGNIQ